MSVKDRPTLRARLDSPVRAAVPLPAAQGEHAAAHRRAVVRRIEDGENAAHGGSAGVGESRAPEGSEGPVGSTGARRGGRRVICFAFARVQQKEPKAKRKKCFLALFRAPVLRPTFVKRVRYRCAAGYFGERGTWKSRFSAEAVLWWRQVDAAKTRRATWSRAISLSLLPCPVLSPLKPPVPSLSSRAKVPTQVAVAPVGYQRIALLLSLAITIAPLIQAAARW